MNKRSLTALIALNVVLVAALAVVNLAPQPASAQSFVRAQYMMVAGDAVGRPEQVIYIIEVTTGRVAAIIFNGSNNTFDILDGRNLTSDLQGAGGRR